MTESQRSSHDHRSPRVVIGGGIAIAMVALTACSGGTGSLGSKGNADEATLTVAIAAIPQTEQMVALLPEFEKANPGIKVNTTVLDETTLGDKLDQQVSTESGEFDVIMGDAIQVSAWSKNGWLVDLNTYASDDADYALDDLLPPARNSVTEDDKMWAAPFSAESSYVYYRKDMFAKAGLTMPDQPTWDEVEAFASELNDDAAGIAGICLRGIASWGGNMPIIVNLIHANGGYVYDADFKPGLDTPEAKAGIQQYVDLLREHGQDGAANANFQECFNLFTQGKAAVWYDSTAISGPMFDPAQNPFAADTAVAATPVGVVNGGGWLSAWTVGLLSTSQNQDAAWKFIRWVTSKDYIDLVGSEYDWGLVPPGTRQSTYENPDYLEAASQYADLTLTTMEGARVDFTDIGANPLERSFYVDIPQWQGTGDEIGRIFAAAVSGDKTVDEAITEANQVLAKTADDGGYTE